MLQFIIDSIIMNCMWCEENDDLIEYCNNEDHRVCKVCYEKYKTTYPMRVEGCPYCKGTQEKLVVYIHSEDSVVADTAIRAATNAINQENTIVIYYQDDGGFDRLVSLIVISTVIVLLMLYALYKRT